MRFAWLCCALVLLTGCGVTLDFDPPDPQRDAAASDFGGPPVDAGVDHGMRDDGGGERDASRPDDGVVDATFPDLGVVDATFPDLSLPDLSLPDLSLGDLGLPDLPVVTFCFSPTDCGAGRFCQLPDGVCSFATGTSGTCVPIPPGCGAVIAPVCGCDGVTYSSACFAQVASANIAYDGPCGVLCSSPPPGCCCTSTDCGGRGECVGADPTVGVCVSVPPDGSCWTDADCTSGTCVGASVCTTCGVICIVPDHLGTCAP